MGAVSSILDAIETRVAAVLPATYKRLKYSYDLEKNNLRGSDNAYGIGVGVGDTVTGTNRAATVDQEFFIILTDKYVNRNDDVSERSILSGLYDNLETVYKDLFQSKGDLGSIILVVSGFSLEEPEKLAEGVLSVRANFTVKYRNQT